MRTARHTRSTLHLPLQLITAAVGRRAAAWSIHVRITPMTARNVRAMSAVCRHRDPLRQQIRRHRERTHLRNQYNPRWNFFQIGEHLEKLQAEWLIISCASFALYFCPQRCWPHQISWIACVLRTEAVTNRCYVNRQINVSLLSTNINCRRPDLTYWETDWRHQ